MKHSYARLAAALVAVAAGTAACSAPVPRGKTGPMVRYRVIFDAHDHSIQECSRGLGDDLLAAANGVVFHDANSKLRVSAARGGEKWHLHVLHKVGGQVVDAVVTATEKASGAFVVDLASFPDPQHFVVVSDDLEAEARDGAVTDRAIVPPYVLSFRMIGREQAETVLSVQEGRRDVKAKVGTAHALLQPANRHDVLLTVVDPAQALSRLFRDAYLEYRPAGIPVTPRVTLEVADTGGHVWYRAEALPRPDGIIDDRAQGPEPSFVLRTLRNDLVALEPPARLALDCTTERPETSASFRARVTGARDRVGYRLTVAHAVPDDRQARSYRLHVQTRELSKEEPEKSVGVTVDRDPSSYPLTATVMHRFSSPWKMPGGCYVPRPAVATGWFDDPAPDVLAGSPWVISPRRASHYEFVRFYGGSRAAGAGLLGLLSGSGGSPGDGSGGGSGDGAGDGSSDGIIPGPSLTPGGGSGTSGGTPSSGTGSGAGGGLGGGASSGGGGDPAPPAVGDIVVDLGCGCKMPGGCKCHPHMWDQGSVMNHIRRYQAVQGPNGQTYQIADYHWHGGHGGSAPCHKNTLIGQVVMEWWVGMTLVQRCWNVHVTFKPCGDMPSGGDKEEFDFGLGLLVDPVPESGDAPHPFNRPELAARLGQLQGLTGQGREIGPLLVAPIRLLRFDPDVLRRRNATSSAYLERLKRETRAGAVDDARRDGALDDWSSVDPGGSGQRGQPKPPR